MFLYSRGVFRTVSTIKDGASWENSQRCSSKMEPLTKTKSVNYFWKIPHFRCLTGFWVRLLFSVHIWEFEGPHFRLFQRLGVLNSLQTTISLILKANQLTANQIDWFLHERDYCLDWVKKWVKVLRNTWWNFCFLVKQLKIPENLSKHYLFKDNNKNTRRRCKNMLKVELLLLRTSKLRVKSFLICF